MTARATLGTALAALALLTGTGCAPGGQDAGHDGGHGGPATLAHVHGLGINPANGDLYAASHYGVFHLPAGGKPEQIANRAQDTMGFTVVGPDHFLGSGHPDPAESGKPPHLGLIESTDAARTWRSVSLEGEVDFHALEAKNGQVYGFDSQSGALLTSADMREWERRSDTPIADLALSPEEGGTMVTTTQDGPALSRDGGRTFRVVDGAPLLVLVDWPSADRMVGVAPDGAVHLSGDGGRTWARRGQAPGAPQALTSTGESDVYVATADGIHHSTDNGATFQLLHPLG